MGEYTTQKPPQEFDSNNPPFPLTAIDRGLLSMRDEDFHRITWADLQNVIASNTLEQLKRLPSDLRRYLAWSHDIKQRYGGITPFVVQERLAWTPLPLSSPSSSSSSSASSPLSTTKINGPEPPRFAHNSTTPFTHPADYAVLANDWPYGFAEGIRHLVVWSKTPIAVDDRRGDVTAESKRVIEDFVQSYFIQPLGPGGEERVVWFKNWVSLQSVRGVDHVHVLVRDVSATQLDKWMVRRDQ